MLALADGHSSCLLFKEVFLEQLPDDVRLLLVNEDFGDPRKVALLADTLLLVKQQRPVHINKVEMFPPRRASTTSSTSDTTSMCFYHARFGSDAKKCVPPCTFAGKDRAGRH
jgi:hypothetical protein